MASKIIAGQGKSREKVRELTGTPYW